ncbi:MAG TPA: thiamine pyrophosphate-binding protein [Anaerolineae bacterium]|nr:thiamine pyrophosphate-binding protein [Anaerolineae bacterium]
MVIGNDEMHGGLLVAEVLAKQGVQFLFTLCGGHISPILVGAEQKGVRVIDVRHEATAVFAADAVGRLSGVPGVAVVTAGPGVTNTVTAVKNAQMAQSPLILLGGATATLLKGRGSLQDIDQMAVLRPHVKWAKSVKQVKKIVPTLEEAFAKALSGIPGPVFVELPIDLLYPESLVREWQAQAMSKSTHWRSRLVNRYIEWHMGRVFSNPWQVRAGEQIKLNLRQPNASQIAQTIGLLRGAQKPVLVVGSQALLNPGQAEALQKAIVKLGIPTYLSGMARGLLGTNELHMRHKRRLALKEADVVVLAGVPADFRLNYGRHIPSKAKYLAINLSRLTLYKNRRPDQAILASPGAFLRQLAGQWGPPPTSWAAWQKHLAERDSERDAEIAAVGEETTEYVNPVFLCQQMENVIGADSIMVGDGGDFVATASYVTRPRGPLSWLDPGAFGTLGAGAGFALGAKLCRPEAEVWLFYGDGSAGYSLAEFDTFARHGIGVTAVVGTDGGWAQIAREQVEIFGTKLSTELARTDYHLVGQGYGAEGIVVRKPEEVVGALQKAAHWQKEGKSTVVNVMLGESEFRKGSISM